jgi:hypothetical protein
MKRRGEGAGEGAGRRGNRIGGNKEKEEDALNRCAVTLVFITKLTCIAPGGNLPVCSGFELVTLTSNSTFSPPALTTFPLGTLASRMISPTLVRKTPARIVSLAVYFPGGVQPDGSSREEGREEGG